MTPEEQNKYNSAIEIIENCKKVFENNGITAMKEALEQALAFLRNPNLPIVKSLPNNIEIDEAMLIDLPVSDEERNSPTIRAINEAHRDNWVAGAKWMRKMAEQLL